MKTLSLLFLLTFAIAGNVIAQEPSAIIKELRGIIADAPIAFDSFLGDADGRDEASGTTFYKTKKEAVASIALPFIMHKESTGHRTFILRYNLNNLDAMMLKLMVVITQGYVDEMNAMVRSGNYTGRDYENSNGANVSEIKDLQGNHIMDYQSTKDQQMVIVYCTKKH